MNFKSFFLLGILFSASLLFTNCSGKSDAELIKATFAYYQKAIINNDGMAAAKCLDQKTLDWFDKLIQMSKETKKSELEKTNYLSKLTVLALRQEFDKKKIEALDAQTAFSFAVKKSLYDQNIIKEYQVNNIKIEDPRAIAALAKDGKTDEDNFIKFIKEENGWKINFAAMINIMNDDATGRLIENIPNENSKAIKAVAKISGKSVKRNIWTPSNRWR